MTTSLNATFTGLPPADAEWPHPEGAAIVRLVHEAVRQDGWVVEDFDNWRDVGWNFIGSRGQAKLEFIVSSMGPQGWMVQVAPSSVPGFLGRALGSRPSASAGEVFELATLVHRVLAQAGPYRDFRWQWDGPPTAHSDPQPVQGA